MKLEKFNLQKALNGAKIVTRDGREVTQLTKFEDAEEYPLGAVLEGKIQSWSIDGYYYIDRLGENNADLFIEAKVRRGWVNVYGNGRDIITSGGYITREDATRNIREDYEYIKTIEITDEL
jgi:hypothetical protein